MQSSLMRTDRIIAVDEFEKGQVFVLAHVVFTANQARVASKKWLKLQKYIRDRIIERDPSLEELFCDNHLPEIHAEWLVQSRNYYRLKNPRNPEYWKEHFEWLEEACKILRHCAPTAYYAMLYDYKSHAINSLISEEILDNPEIIKYYGKSNYNSLIAIRSSPYARGLSSALASMETMFSNRDLTYEFICDDYDHCKGFSTLEVFDELHKRGLASKAFHPRFLSSENEQLIQMADVAAYLGGQVTWVGHMEKISSDFVPNDKISKIIKLYWKYLWKLDGERGAHPPPRGHEVDRMSHFIYSSIVASFLKNHPTISQRLLNKRNLEIESFAKERGFLP